MNQFAISFIRSNGSSVLIRNRRQFLTVGLLCGASSFLHRGDSLLFAQSTGMEPRRDLDDIYTQAVDEAVRKGLAYLESREENGAFNTVRWGQNLGICSLAGLAFLSRGVRLGFGVQGELLARIAARLQAFSLPSGFIFDERTKSHGPMYEHAFATLFLTEVHGTGPNANFESTIKSAIDLIVLSQNSQGGWRYDPRPTEADVSVTVSQIMALRAAKNAGFFVPEETIQRAIDYLQRAQNPDGGFAYQLDGSPSRYPLTAGAVVAMYNSGVNEGRILDKAFEYLKNSEGIDRFLQTNYFFYAHYYSAQAFWHRGGEDWPGWYKKLATYILPLQSADGAWSDQNQGSEYATAMACLILNTPRSVLPIYQR